MRVNEQRATLGYSGGVTSRAKSLVAKTAAVVAGGVVLAGALVVSVMLFAVALALVLVVGGYLWWKTRDLRRQIREHVDEQQVQRFRNVAPSDDVIEGVVISRDQTRDENRTR